MDCLVVVGVGCGFIIVVDNCSVWLVWLGLCVVCVFGGCWLVCWYGCFVSCIGFGGVGVDCVVGVCCCVKNWIVGGYWLGWLGVLRCLFYSYSWWWFGYYCVWMCFSWCVVFWVWLFDSCVWLVWVWWIGWCSWYLVCRCWWYGCYVVVYVWLCLVCCWCISLVYVWWWCCLCVVLVGKGGGVSYVYSMLVMLVMYCGGCVCVVCVCWCIV